MWTNELPAKQYLYYYLQQNPQSYVNGWVKVGEQLKEYGKTLIKQHPFAYIRHFIIPNFFYFFKGYDLPVDTSYIATTYAKDYYKMDIEQQDYTLPFFNAISPLRKVLDIVLRFTFFAAVILLLIKRKSIGFSAEQFRHIGFLLLFAALYILFITVTHPVNTFRYIMPLEFVQLFFTIMVFSKLVQLRVNKIKTT